MRVFPIPYTQEMRRVYINGYKVGSKVWWRYIESKQSRGVKGKKYVWNSPFYSIENNI